MGVTGTLKSSVGLGSGIEIESLVNQLVDLEGKYTTEKFEKDEVAVQAKITAFGNLQGAITDFKEAVDKIRLSRTFEENTVRIANDPTTSSTTTYFEASATSRAVTGSYNIEVEQLAQAHKLSKDFNTKSQVIGTGTLRIVVGQGQSVTKTNDYTVDSSNNSVEGVKNLINATSNETGVVASLIESDAGVKLIISSKETGVKNTLGISVLNDADGDDEDDAGLSQLDMGNLSQINAAQDTNVRIDGQLITSAKTTLVDVIEGTTIDLKKAEDGKVHTLTISVDEGKIKDKLKDYVEKYNDIVDIINDVSKTNASDPDLAGDLVGDANLRTIEYRLRRSLTYTNSTPSGLNTLANLGITTNVKTGKLSLNDFKYDSATKSNVDDLVVMFTESLNGVAVRQFDDLDSIINSDGVITKASQKLNDRLKEITVEKAEHQLRLERRRIFLTLRFASLDTLLGQLQATGDFVSQSLSKSVEPLAFKK